MADKASTILKKLKSELRNNKDLYEEMRDNLIAEMIGTGVPHSQALKSASNFIANYLGVKGA